VQELTIPHLYDVVFVYHPRTFKDIAAAVRFFSPVDSRFKYNNLWIFDKSPTIVKKVMFDSYYVVTLYCTNNRYDAMMPVSIINSGKFIYATKLTD